MAQLTKNSLSLTSLAQTLWGFLPASEASHPHQNLHLLSHQLLASLAQH